jgi:enamine deaminase RidA (YjgF/YER057c/UK114 family)
MTGRLAIWIVAALLACGFCVGVSGCGGDAGLEMRTADVMHSGTAAARQALDEFQADLEAADDAKESMLILNFTQLVLQDIDDQPKVSQHIADFGAALAKLRRMREASRRRYQAAIESLDTMDEVATDLHKFAVDSLTMEDETRRYFTGWVEQIRTAREQQRAQKEAERAQTRAEREKFATDLLSQFGIQLPPRPRVTTAPAN